MSDFKNMQAVKGQLTRAKILDFIKYRSMTGLTPPTYREIGEAVGLKSTSTVYSHIHSLEREMKVKSGYKARSIVLKRKPEEICSCCGGTGWKQPVRKEITMVVLGNE